MTSSRTWKLVGAVWRFFVSTRLALVLLVLLGIGSVLGTFLPQIPQTGLSLQHLEPRYSPLVFSLLRFFQVFDLFHSWWFSLLLSLLALNLLACSLPRIQALPRIFKSGPGTRRRAGFLLVHLGIMIVLVAGAFGQVAAEEGTLTLLPGEESDRIQIREDALTRSRKLPFTIRCRDFVIERFASGSGGIRDYVSVLEVVEAGRPALTRRVEVNAPLVYAGYSFYQSSYQTVPRLDRARLRVKDAQGERVLEAASGDRVARGSDGTGYVLSGYRENFKRLGEAVRIETRDPKARQRFFWVFSRYPGFAGRNRPGDVGLDLLGYRPGFATILSVVKNPSVPVLWLGCGFLVVGLLVVFLKRMHGSDS
jgi:cytochrome c biogenesis protein